MVSLAHLFTSIVLLSVTFITASHPVNLLTTCGNVCDVDIIVPHFDACYAFFF